MSAKSILIQITIPLSEHRKMITEIAESVFGLLKALTPRSLMCLGW